MASERRPYDLQADHSYNIAPRQRAAVIHRDSDTGSPVLETMYVNTSCGAQSFTNRQAVGTHPALDEASSDGRYEHHQRQIRIPPRPLIWRYVAIAQSAQEMRDPGAGILRMAQAVPYVKGGAFHQVTAWTEGQ